MGSRLRPFPGVKGNKYPGTGYRKCKCDICGFYVRKMDCQLVDDKLAYKQQGMLVCKWCKDDYNPQLYPKVVIDKILSDPTTVRQDSGDIYASNNDPSLL